MNLVDEGSTSMFWNMKMSFIRQTWSRNLLFVVNCCKLNMFLFGLNESWPWAPRNCDWHFYYHLSFYRLNWIIKIFFKKFDDVFAAVNSATVRFNWRLLTVILSINQFVFWSIHWQKMVKHAHHHFLCSLIHFKHPMTERKTTKRHTWKTAAGDSLSRPIN